MDLAWEILWDVYPEAGTTLPPSQRGLVLLGVLGQVKPGIHPSCDTPCTERGQETCPFLSASPFSFPFLAARVNLLLPCFPACGGRAGLSCALPEWGDVPRGDRVGEGGP